jgi:hypothetical protein
MTHRILFVLQFLLISFSLQAQSTKKSPVHIGLVYPLSSNGLQAEEYSNGFSVHAIAGVSAAEESFCAAGVTNVVMDNATGFIGAGFSNHILNTADGVQVAGFANTVTNEVRGFMGAGFLNYCGNMEGVQAAGFANITMGDVQGVQAAGFLNTALSAEGAQIAGFGNISHDAEVQASGFVNVARDVNTQIAGFINIAKRVEGVQLAGFINIADSSAYPIGLVNIVKNGEKGISFTWDENNTGLISFRSGGKVLYGILGGGYNFKSEQNLVAMEAGIGAHLHISRSFRINTEIACTNLTDFRDGNYLRSSVRVLPAVKLANNIELFGGVNFNHVIYNNRIGENLTDHYVWSHENNKWDYFNGLYIGFMGGVQFNF